MPGSRTHRGNFYLRFRMTRRVVTKLLHNAFTARERARDREHTKREREEKSRRTKETHRGDVR